MEGCYLAWFHIELFCPVSKQLLLMLDRHEALVSRDNDNGLRFAAIGQLRGGGAGGFIDQWGGGILVGGDQWGGGGSEDVARAARHDADSGGRLLLHQGIVYSLVIT